MNIWTRILPLAIILLFNQNRGLAASWTQLANLAPGGGGTMLLLTDGTVMVLDAFDSVHWLRLTPDAHGSYINGTWTPNPITPMGTPRLYFASNVLPSGKVWVFGGEYTGAGLPLNEDGTGQIYDPVSNAWSPVSAFPNQVGCSVEEFGGVLTNGSPVITSIASTAGWQAGWSVNAPPGVPSGAIIVSVDSATQIHISANATFSGGTVMILTVPSTGNTTQGSNIITGIPSTSGYQAGWLVSGTGIPGGAAITSVDSATAVHINTNATASGTAVALTFTVRTLPPTCFGDDPSMSLPGGKILAGSSRSLNTYLYNVAADAWALTAVKKYDTSSEEGWAIQADGTIVTYDIAKSISAGKGYAERYDPVANTWSSISPADGTANGTLPVLSSNVVGDELGPELRLNDGRIFVVGANGQTALYTPSTNTWAAGPEVIGSLGGEPYLFTADDAPGAVLPSGDVIFAADAGFGVASSGATTAGSPVITGIPSTAQLQANWAVSGSGIPPGATIKSIDSVSQVTLSENATASGATVTLEFGGVYSAPAQLFDFNPVSNLITPVSPAIPDLRLANIPSYVVRMLVLPTGQLLLADASNALWVYTPDGAAEPPWQPAISGVTSSGGLFTLSGTQLTGQTAGATYGDDAEMDENYPIVSFANSSGSVYYARTTNWSYIGVGGGTTPQTVNFALPSQMPSGSYSLTTSAAGISSTPVAVTLSPDLSTITVLPSISSAQDAESARTAVVQGQWMAIYGLALANSTRQWNNSDFKGGTTPGSPLPTVLDGVQVTIGGQSAPVLFISPTQIDVQVPANLPLGNANAIVNNNGTLSAAVPVAIVPSAPSFYSYAAGTSLYASAVHLNGTLIGDPAISGSSVEKALPGETIVMFANGLAAAPAGVIVAATAFSPSITMTAGSYPLTDLGAALVYAGEYQINVQLPLNIPAGTYALSMTVPNGSTSTGGVTVLLPVGP